MCIICPEALKSVPVHLPERFRRAAVALGKKPVKVALAVKAAALVQVYHQNVFCQEQFCGKAQPFPVDKGGGRNVQMPPEGSGEVLLRDVRKA